MNGVLFFLVFITAFIAGGAAVYFASSKRLRLRRAKHSRSNIITNAMEYRLSLGPRIVAIGGGTGLSTLLNGLKGFTRNITAVVAVTDEGGSSVAESFCRVEKCLGSEAD